MLKFLTEHQSEDKCNLSDFELSMDVGARQAGLSISESRADIEKYKK